MTARFVARDAIKMTHWPTATPLANMWEAAAWRPGGSGSVVEHLLAKERVTGSNPVFRSDQIRTRTANRAAFAKASATTGWRSSRRPVRSVAAGEGQFRHAGLVQFAFADGDHQVVPRLGGFGQRQVEPGVVRER